MDCTNKTSIPYLSECNFVPLVSNSQDLQIAEFDDILRRLKSEYNVEQMLISENEDLTITTEDNEHAYCFLLAKVEKPSLMFSAATKTRLMAMLIADFGKECHITLDDEISEDSILAYWTPLLKIKINGVVIGSLFRTQHGYGYADIQIGATPLFNKWIALLSPIGDENVDNYHNTKTA